MKALRTVGVVAFFMLSACAVSNREGYDVVRQPSAKSYVVVSSPGNEPQQYSSGQVHAIAYGQVLSYWAAQLK